jgi:uncharacterized membrane protein
MPKARLEAFSDGVLAIILTIMVIDFHIPKGDQLSALIPILPVLLCYVLSFLYIGIYWNNHHHMLHAVQHVSGAILWANLHLLFWLSLLPFATGWMGENHFATYPTVFYGSVLLMAALAYWILARLLIAREGPDSLLARAVGRDRKGLASIALYLIALPLAFLNHWIALGIYAAVAAIWHIPDRRIERVFASE